MTTPGTAPMTTGMTAPGTAPMTGWVMTPGTPAGDPGDAAEWITVTSAMTRAGVSRRTVRRWVAAGLVESKLVEEDGRQVRMIRGDTLPAAGTDDDRVNVHRVSHRDDRDDGTGDSHRVGAGADRGDAAGDGTWDMLRDTVTRQAEEIMFLRAQIERRDQAEAELRRLLLASQNALQLALDRPALPPAPIPTENVTTPRRVRWWALWARR